MRKINYNPNDRYHLNASLLITSVIIGTILGFSLGSATLLVLSPALSQYRWLIDRFNRIIFPEQIRALDRLTNSAALADRRDNYTIGRFRANAKYILDMSHSGYYLLSIDSNGITGTRNLNQVANEVGAAFHRPASLESLSNGIAVYRINLSVPKVKVHDDDF